MHQVRVGESLDAQAVRCRLVVAPPITVEVVHPGMPTTPVGLEDQPPVLDETVDALASAQGAGACHVTLGHAGTSATADRRSISSSLSARAQPSADRSP